MRHRLFVAAITLLLVAAAAFGVSIVRGGAAVNLFDVVAAAACLAGVVCGILAMRQEGP